jgi:RNA polymerase sigma-70 factor (ECF subfamily)
MTHTDRSSFTALLEQHRRQVHAHIFSLVLNEHDAQEVFQETSVTLWQKFDKYQPGTDFRAWAFRIAYYHVLKHRERQVRRPAVLGDELLELIDKESIVMSDMLDARSEALLKCREKLPARDRDLLERYYRPKATAKRVAFWQRTSLRSMYRALRRVHDTLFDCVNRVLEGTDG